jgi:hypothetical protein
MSSYDLAISMDQTTLNGTLSQTFGLPRLAHLFTGQLNETVLGKPATVTWTIQQAPQISLAQPTTAQWKAAIDAAGGAPTPVTNAGILTLPALKLVFSYDGESGNTTIPASVIWTWAVSGGTLTLTPLAAIVDTSGMSPAAQTIVQYIVLPLVMQQAQTYVKTIALPSVQYGGLNFGTPAAAITADRVIMVAAVAGQPTPAIPDASTLPSDPLFIQVSQNALQSAATAHLNALIGQSKSFSGSKYGADYSGSVTLQNGTITLGTPDPTQVSGTVGYGLTASASVGGALCGMDAAASSL